MARAPSPKQIQAIIDKKFSEVEKIIVEHYKNAMKAIDAEIKALYKKAILEGGKLSPGATANLRHLIQTRDEAAKIIGATSRIISKELDAGIRSVLHESILAHGWEVSSAVKTGLSFGLIPDAAIRRSLLGNIFYDRARSKLARGGVTGIQDALTQGLIRGLGYKDMIKLVNGEIGSNAASALLIFRTEGNGAATAGALSVYEQAQEMGIDGAVIWLATLDDRTRDSHGAIDGTPAGPDGTWTLEKKDGTTEQATRPGDESLSAENRCNCRCSIRYDVSGVSPEFRRVRDYGMMPYMTYSEWKEQYGN